MSDHENCDRSEDGAIRRSGKLSDTASRLVFWLFERSDVAENSGDSLTKISGQIPGCWSIRFAAAVGQSVHVVRHPGQPPSVTKSPTYSNKS